MYSGNHTPSNPINTIVSAAKDLSDNNDIIFVFIGEGLDKKIVNKAIKDGYKNISEAVGSKNYKFLTEETDRSIFG